MRYLAGSTTIPVTYVSLLYLIIIILVTKDLYKKYFRLNASDLNIPFMYQIVPTNKKSIFLSEKESEK